MNMINKRQIKLDMSTQDLDKSIIANRIRDSTILSSAIRLQQIIIASMEDIM